MSSNQFSSIKSPLLLSFVLLVGMVLGYKMSSSIKNTFQSRENEAVLDEVVKLIELKYADTLNHDKLVESGIEGIIKNLDPHTVYIPKEELQIENEELEGSFLGIGIEFFMLDDTVNVSYVMPDGPSAKTALQAGDKLLTINADTIAGKKLSEKKIIQKIRGKRKDNVEFFVKHIDNKSEIITIERAQIPFKSLVASHLVNADIGYIKLRLFNETTYDEFKTALSNLKEQGATKIIIDVRDNPGGYMDAVASIADELLTGNKILVKTKGKDETEQYFANKDGLFENGKVVILVNENSASASEILAGCMQDYDRGIVVGRRTFGKGLVQEQFDLPNKAALRITTARYYLPSGRCIQKSFASGKDEYYDDIYRRYKKGEMSGQDSFAHKTQTKYYTTNKRIVYGDEGISPDYFIKLDTSELRDYNNLQNTFILEQFGHQYYHQHQGDFKKYKNINSLSTKNLVTTQVEKEMIRNLLQLLPNFKVTPQLLEKLRIDLAALFAQKLFGQDGKSKILSTKDDFIKKAIQLLN